MALGRSTLLQLTHNNIHSPIARLTLRDEEPAIAQLRYWLNSYSKYNIPLKTLPLLLCTKNTALRDVSQDKYSTRRIYLLTCLLMLYFPYKLVAVL